MRCASWASEGAAGPRAGRIRPAKALAEGGPRLAICLCLAAVASACAVPIASDLDDAEANRVFVALDRASVDAAKEPDPAAEGKWRISVTRDDVSRALSVMREELLPRAEPRGVLDAIGKDTLVPSEAAEQAQLMAGVAGELERSLDGIDGVLRARVHLSVAAASPAAGLLHAASAPRESASVLIEHRGATPPISADAVARLVAGGVAGLAPSDVAVVMVARATPAAYGPMDLAHVGPIAVARASVRRLQGALAALVALVALLAAATLLLYSRLARARAALAAAASGPGAAGPLLGDVVGASRKGDLRSARPS